MSGFRVMQAVSEIRAAMQAMIEEDGVIVTDLDTELPAEAATLDDALRGVVRALLRADAMAEACTAQARALAARCAWFEFRSDACRAIIAAAMDAIGERKRMLPEATISVTAAKGHVIVTDLKALPLDCVRVKIEPNKSAIAAKLAAGEKVPGAELSNPRPGLMIRTT